MANSKPKSNSKNLKNKKKKARNDGAKFNRQLTSLILFATSVLLFCLAVIPAEGLWGILRTLMFGLFGFCSYLFPFFMLAVSLLLTLNKNDKNINVKLTGLLLAITVVCCIVHIFSYEEGNTYFESIAIAFNEHTPLSSGVFGALIGGIFLLITGGNKLAALIICFLLLFVLFMLLTGITLGSLLNAFGKSAKKIGEYTNEKVTEYGEKKEEKEEQKKKKISNPDISLGPDNIPEESLQAEEEISENEETVEEIDELDSLLSLADIKKLDDNFEKVEKVVKIDDIIKNSDIDEADSEETEVSASEPENDEDDWEKSAKCVYSLPPLDCLNSPKRTSNESYEAERKKNANKLVETLNSFGVETRIVGISQGPSVTRYEIQPAAGVKISKITNLADDIALNLAASGVRIEAPIPNKAAVGIEIPNKNRQSVTLREVIDQQQYRDAKSKLTVALGKDITGEFVYSDLVKMPHLLIAGTTGSGKSVCLNSMIVSILYNATPEEVKLLMIDPKQVEFTIYNGIPHLLVPVVSDPRKASGALAWAVTEMLTRYKTFSENSVRDISGYNSICESEGKKKMPQIVIFIDELSDLMMAAPNEVEDSICRLAQMARAAGMHLVIATQRPSVDVITGIIKANIPSRISLSVSSQVDSRTIIDSVGAEKLLGNGDMLYYPVGIPKPIRVQGCYLSDKEVENVVTYIKNQAQTVYDDEVMKEIEKQAANANTKKKDVAPQGDESDGPADEMLPKAIEVVVEAQSASTTLLQRKLKLGYARAARIVDDLEERGIIGPYEGAKPRKVLVSKQQWLEMNALAQGGANKSYDDDEKGESSDE